MQEFTLDRAGWDAFWARWSEAMAQVPGMRAAVLEEAGDRARDAVRDAIDASGLNDRRGRVKLWQNRHVGSKGGYAAVRADSVMVTAGPRDRQVLNAGALTNYLTNGHKARQPSGRAKRYVPRAGMTRVRGYGFYKTAAAQAERIALEAAQAYLDRIGGMLK